jgi:hypothetical protein
MNIKPELPMANDLEIRGHLDTMRYLPPSLAKLERSLGTVQWAGQPVRMNFPGGMDLSLDQRTELEARLQSLRQLTSGEHLAPEACSKARLSLLTSLLLGYPAVGTSSKEAAEARANFYLEAVGDIAPWAIDAAIKRWVRGDVENANVDFAPSPGGLRRLCERETEPFKQQMRQIERLLSAVSIDRAMNPKPLETALRSIK